MRPSMGELLYNGFPYFPPGGSRIPHLGDALSFLFISTFFFLEGFSACGSKLYYITILVYLDLVMALLDGESPAGH